MTDITQLKHMLNDRAQSVCEHLLPNGTRQGRNWCVGSIQGESGASLKVCVEGEKLGRWKDFAPGDVSGDLIDLWRFGRGVSLPDALTQIRAWLGVKEPEFSKPNKTYRKPELPKAVAPKSAVLQYLSVDRKVSADAIRAYRVAEEDRVMVFPLYRPDGTLANIKRRSIDRQPGKQPKTWAESDCEPILFGWQAIDRDAREVTIAEGEIDALTFRDYGFPALSVPFGGGKGSKQGQWIECEFERLLQFEVIYLGLDMDPEGDAAAEEIANRLGRHRCRRLKLAHKDINDCRRAGMSQGEIQRCFDTAASLDPPELRKPRDFRDSVLALFWPAGEREVGYRLPFSKVGDRVVFRAGELSIWSGATSAGKSQILSHASVAWGAQGARVCIASLEMRPPQFLKRMVKQASNVDRASASYIEKTLRWLDGFLWIFDVTGKSKIGKVLEIFEYARARYGCDVFILDSLMRLGIGSEDYEGQERAVFELVSWAVDKAVHLHLVAHSRKGERQAQTIPDNEDVKGASEISANAFNILSIWRNKTLEEKLSKFEDAAARGDGAATAELDQLRNSPMVVLNVSKQRNGDWDGKIGLWFDRATYQYRDAWSDRYGIRYVPDDTEEAG